MPAKAWVLPDGVATIGDVGRMQRELAEVDNFLGQANVRQPGAPTVLPKTSQIFTELVASNTLNLLVQKDRDELASFLQALRMNAPVVHMSFSSEPSPLFGQKMVTWIRKNLHLYGLLQIGLVPGMGMGAMVRTTNKIYNFGLKDRFIQKKPLLMEAIRGSGSETSQGTVVEEPVAG